MEITVSASDPNGDPVAYNWSVPSGWVIKSRQMTDRLTVVAPTRLLASGMVAVTAGDGNAGSASASLYVATLDGTWGIAELIESRASGNVGIADIAVDLYGCAVTVWDQYDGARYNIYANRFVPGIGWGSDLLIETDDTGSAGHPRISVDTYGNAIAVWDQYDGVRRNIWANRYVPATGWSTAVLIETGSADALDPQVAIDSGGNAIAVWAQFDGIRMNIRANRYVLGTGWGTAVSIETSSEDARYPQVAMDPDGNAIAVWCQHDGVRNNIWANRFTPGTGWGTAALLETDDSGNAGQPRVAMDSEGNAIVVWNQHDGAHLNLWARRYVPATGWDAATLIETGSGAADSPDVAVNPSGKAIAVWRQQDGVRTNIWANHFVPGTGWGTATLIDVGGGRAESPRVALDHSGNAIAVWYQWDGRSDRIQVRRYIAGTGWDSAAAVSIDSEWNADSPSIAVDSCGNAIAVWSQFDGTRSNLWAIRFE